MEKLLPVLLLMYGFRDGSSEVTEVKVTPEVTPQEVRPHALLLSLAGSEGEAVTSSIASLLQENDYHVTFIKYGRKGGRPAAEGMEIIEIPLAEDDLLYDPTGGGLGYVTPSLREKGLYEITSAREAGEAANKRSPMSYDEIMTSSLRHACKQLYGAQINISRVHIFVTPLYIHDLCTLNFARQFDSPVVGLVTSRIGSWWSWYHLDIVPSLATASVPPNTLSANFGFWERLWNVIQFYSYLSRIESDWVQPLMMSLPSEAEALQPISELYATVSAVMVAWDKLLDPDLPVTPLVTSLAGSRWETDGMTKDTLVKTLSNRNGAILCSLVAWELWVGPPAQDAILEALSFTPFTVIWRGVAEAWEGAEERNNERGLRKGTAIFVHQGDLPIRAMLAHPRHRLLVSMCGVSEATTAILLGSPTLCLPVTYDQMLTSQRLRDLGLALVIPASDVTVQNVRDAVRDLTTNRSYRGAGRQLAEHYIHQPLATSDLVIHALATLRRPPNRFATKQTKRLSLLAQSNGDVIAAMLVSMTALSTVAVYVVIVFVKRFVNTEKEKRKGD